MEVLKELEPLMLGYNLEKRRFRGNLSVYTINMC